MGGPAEQELLKNVDVPAFERNMGRDVLIGGIGCYHSHLGCLAGDFGQR